MSSIFKRILQAAIPVVVGLILNKVFRGKDKTQTPVNKLREAGYRVKNL